MEDMEKDWEDEESSSLTANRYGVVKVTPYTNHYLIVLGDEEGNGFYTSDKTYRYGHGNLRLLGVYVIYMLADEGVFLVKELFNDPDCFDTGYEMDENFWDYIDVDKELLNNFDGEWKVIQLSGDI